MPITGVAEFADRSALPGYILAWDEDERGFIIEGKGRRVTAGLVEEMLERGLLIPTDRDALGRALSSFYRDEDGRFPENHRDYIPPPPGFRKKRNLILNLVIVTLVLIALGLTAGVAGRLLADSGMPVTATSVASDRLEAGL